MERKDLKLNIHYSALHISYWFVMAAATLYAVPLLRAKGLTETQIGLVLSVKYIASSASQVIISYFADRYRKVLTLKRILLVLCLISIPISFIFYILPGSFGLAIFTYIIFGSSINGATAYVNAIASRFTNVGRKLYYSYARGLGSIGWGIGSIIISYIVDATHVEIILFIQIIMLITMFLVIVTIEPIPEKIEEQKAEDKSHSYAYLFLHNPGFDCFLIASTLLFMGYTLQTTFLVDIVAKTGGGNIELGYVEMWQSVCELLPAVIYVWIAKKMNTFSILRVCAISCFLMVTSVMLAQNVTHLLLLQVFDIFGYGMYWNVSMDYVYKAIDKNDWVKGQALVSVCSLGIGGIIGSFFGGNIMDVMGIDGLLQISMVMAVVGVIVMLVGMFISSNSKEKEGDFSAA